VPDTVGTRVTRQVGQAVAIKIACDALIVNRNCGRWTRYPAATIKSRSGREPEMPLVGGAGVAQHVRPAVTIEVVEEALISDRNCWSRSTYHPTAATVPITSARNR
jgi:hypothetical protein